ncbi:MAG: NAD(+)/NADH kinase [Tissierellia bacterium]|nr:NAD(+)/NADH kinase [Tissierellia bacterium]
MSSKIINIITNANHASKRTASKLNKELKKHGFKPFMGFQKNAELTVTVGGDGAFIKAVHKNDFPKIPHVGINTGHLGFYQEISPEQIDKFVQDYKHGNFEVEEIKLVRGDVYTKNKTFRYHALNEVVLKAQHSKIIHMNIFIDRNHVEKFSGDGILVATPSGSTAYNFSSGGSIVYPTLDIMQMTPISPVNSVAYRSLGSSVIVPGDHTISLVIEKRYANSNLLLVDGTEYMFKDLLRVNLRLSDKFISKLVFSQDSYWDNIKDKFL